MLREEYLRRLVDNAHIELVLSASGGSGGRVYWPWKMNPPKEALQRMRNSCEKYIIDSDPLDDSVTTKDVLDCAHNHNAEVASLQDVYQDKDKTVDSLLRGLKMYDSHAFDGDLLLPLQEPYVECWEELGEPTEHLLGIGGLKDGTPKERIKATNQLRNAIGSDGWIHGFGWGVNGIADYIRDNPNALDSVDYSTPVQNAMNEVDCSPGEEVSSVIAMEMATTLVQDLREVSDYPRTATAEELRANGEVGLERYI
jgi:hypothetical protein